MRQIKITTQQSTLEESPVTNMKHVLKDENGSGLVLSLMVLLVLSVLGAALGTVTIGSYKLSDHTRDSNSAYYIAEAGANMAYEEIASQINQVYEKNSDSEVFFSVVPTLSSKTYNKFTPQFGDQPEAIITVEPIDTTGDERQFTIKSVGEVAGKTRTVEKPIQVNWKSKASGDIIVPTLPLDAAIIYNGFTNMNGNLTVLGEIKKTERAASLSRNKLTHADGRISVIENSEWDAFKENFPAKLNLLVKNMISQYDFSSGTAKDKYDVEVTEENDFVKNTGGITFGKDVEITGDIVANGGNILFEGDTKIIGNIIANSGEIIFRDGKNVEITGNVIANGGTINFDNGVTINGSIINSNTNRDLNLKKEMVVNGNIINTGGKINFSNVSNEINGAVIAPNGLIQFNGQSTILGIMATNSFGIDGTAKITYSDKYKKHFPFSSSNDTGSDADDLITTEPAIEP